MELLSTTYSLTTVPEEVVDNVSTFFIEPLHAGPAGESVSWAVYLSLMVGLAVPSNVAVVVAVVRSPMLRRQLTNFFVVNLCLVDLVAALVVMPVSITLRCVSTSTFVSTANDVTSWCPVERVGTTFVAFASVLSATAISAERCYSIRSPMSHAAQMTIGRTLMAIASFWILAGVVGSVPVVLGWSAFDHRLRLNNVVSACSRLETGRQAMLSSKTGSMIFVVVAVTLLFVLPAVVMGTAYCAIYRVARRTARQIAPAAPSVAATPSVYDQGLQKQTTATSSATTTTAIGYNVILHQQQQHLQQEVDCGCRKPMVSSDCLRRANGSLCQLYSLGCTAVSDDVHRTVTSSSTTKASMTTMPSIADECLSNVDLDGLDGGGGSFNVGSSRLGRLGEQSMTIEKGNGSSKNHSSAVQAVDLSTLFSKCKKSITATVPRTSDVPDVCVVDAESCDIVPSIPEVAFGRNASSAVARSKLKSLSFRSKSSSALVDCNRSNHVIADHQTQPTTGLGKPTAGGGTGSEITGCKAATTLLIVVLSFVPMWTPFFVKSLYAAIDDWLDQSSISSSVAAAADSGSVNRSGITLYVVEAIADWLGFSTFAINPVIYGWMNRAIRDELRSMFDNFRWQLSVCWQKRARSHNQTAWSGNSLDAIQAHGGGEHSMHPGAGGCSLGPTDGGVWCGPPGADDYNDNDPEDFFQFLERTSCSVSRVQSCVPPTPVPTASLFGSANTGRSSNTVSSAPVHPRSDGLCIADQVAKEPVCSERDSHFQSFMVEATREFSGTDSMASELVRDGVSASLQ